MSEDLDSFRLLMSISTSEGFVGDMKNAFWMGFLRYCLTLPLPSFLVPTPFTKGGGVGQTPQLSQKPLPP